MKCEPAERMCRRWRSNVVQNLDLPRSGAGQTLVVVVSGSDSDAKYWQRRFADTCRDVFRQDRRTRIVSMCERTRKGNFLGSFNAWSGTKGVLSSTGGSLPDVGLMSMVFGWGKRLSPFTQGLGNRKSSFPTPFRGQDEGAYLCAADLSNLYSNLWIRHLGESGFRGMVVKWGDEAVVPGAFWSSGGHDYRDVDAVRFVWQTEPTEALAREKEWVVTDARTGLMTFQYARQDIRSLQERLSRLDSGKFRVGVNLGSLAISYEFLDVALEVMHTHIVDPVKWADWDPYIWIALFCRDESEWRAEVDYEDRIGATGIRALEAHYPDIYATARQLRVALESRQARPLKVGVLDFGEAMWIDMGLHVALRRNLELLTARSIRGIAARELFRIPTRRDKRGNTIVGSVVPASADIGDSVLIDTVILDPDTCIRGGVVIGGRHRTLHMPHGGSALFCAVDHLAFSGPHGVAFRCLGPQITIPEGGRHTTLLLPQGPEHMVSNESIQDYTGDNYSKPILGNRLSFEEAGDIMSRIEGYELEARWLRAWSNWVS